MTSTEIHPSITVERLVATIQVSMVGTTNPGFCIACGEEIDGVEPDARNYHCEYCEKATVFGAEELLFMIGG